MMSDNINPDHYKNETSLECIEAMQIAFGREKVFHFCLCNAWKYLWRWQNKNGTEDLEKAKWYVNEARNIVEDRESSPSFRNQLVILAEMDNYIDKHLPVGGDD